MADLDVPGHAASKRGHDVPLCEGDVGADPFQLFQLWYSEAAEVVRLPEAAAVATVDASGRPSLRMVLVKELAAEGFVFFTNHGSQKGRELLARPQAALLFYWDPLGRQVRIEGPVEQVSAAESDAYFATRPRGSQLSAAASAQSAPAASRAALEAEVAKVAARFGEGPVARPPQWGGFRVGAHSYEFWQNRDDRLHDRLRFERRPGGGWSMQRLQP